VEKDAHGKSDETETTPSIRARIPPARLSDSFDVSLIIQILIEMRGQAAGRLPLEPGIAVSPMNLL